LQTWERGILIHALGDAYAHSHEVQNYLAINGIPVSVGSEDVAFSFPLGHFQADNDLGHEYDLIGYRPQLYQQYIQQLWSVLGTISPNPSGADQSYLNILSKHAPFSPMDEQKAIAELRGIAISMGYNHTYNPDEISPADPYILDPEMQNITPEMLNLL